MNASQFVEQLVFQHDMFRRSVVWHRNCMHDAPVPTFIIVTFIIVSKGGQKTIFTLSGDLSCLTLQSLNGTMALKWSRFWRVKRLKMPRLRQAAN